MILRDRPVVEIILPLTVRLLRLASSILTSSIGYFRNDHGESRIEINFKIGRKEDGQPLNLRKKI